MTVTPDPARGYRIAAAVAVAPVLALVSLFVLFPVATIVVSAFDPGALGDTVTDPALRRVFWFTAWQAAASTALTLAVGIPLAWAVSTRSWRGARLVSGVVSAPFVMPTVVMALAIRSLLPDGADSGITAILVAHVLFNVAVIVRAVGPRWSALDPGLGEAARVLGADRIRCAVDVTWPQLRGSVLNAAAIVFVFCFTSFGVVSILGGPRERTVEVEILRRAVQIGDTGGAVALSIAQLAVIAVVLGVLPRTGSGRAPSRVHLRPLSDAPGSVRLAVACIASVGVVLAAAPLVAVTADSVRDGTGWTVAGWRRLFDGSLRSLGVDPADAFRNTIVFAVVATLVAVPAATALAVAGVHLGRPGRRLGTLALAPIVVSAVTMAFGIVLAFDVAPIRWRDDPWLLPMVHAMVALPLVHRVVAPAVAAVRPSQREAARVLGAAPLRTILDVDLSQSRRAIAAGAGLAAAVSIGEFGASTLLARSGSTTVPVMLGRLAGRAGDVPQEASQALAALMGLAVVAVMARA